MLGKARRRGDGTRPPMPSPDRSQRATSSSLEKSLVPPEKLHALFKVCGGLLGGGWSNPACRRSTPGTQSCCGCCLAQMYQEVARHLIVIAEASSDRGRREISMRDVAPALLRLRASNILVPVQSAMTVLLPSSSAGVAKGSEHRPFPSLVTVECERALGRRSLTPRPRRRCELTRTSGVRRAPVANGGRRPGRSRQRSPTTSTCFPRWRVRKRSRCWAAMGGSITLSASPRMTCARTRASWSCTRW